MQSTINRHPLRLLGVFAHPDDEVFCAGGALALWAEAGNDALIVSATRGESGQIQAAHSATRQTLGAVREQELRAACGALGVGQVECLDYADGALANVDPERLAADVVSFIRDYQPDIVVTFGLDGGSGHPDHIAISLATTRACQVVAREDGWAPQLYYSVFPQRHGLLCESLARWLATRGEPFRGSPMFARGLALVAEEAALMGYVADDVQTHWFPAEFAIMEQGERGSSLYLIVSGHVQVVAEDAHGARRTLQTLGPGQFLGAEALIERRPHAASYIADDTVTCLALSQQAPTAFDGRGEAGYSGAAQQASHAADADGGHDRLIRLDITACLARKVAALAAHRSQFAVAPEMLTIAPLWQVMSDEYFAPVALPTPLTSPRATDAGDLLELEMSPLLALPR